MITANSEDHERGGLSMLQTKGLLDCRTDSGTSCPLYTAGGQLCGHVKVGWIRASLLLILYIL